MNKKVKKGLIWSASLATIGGITAAIAVPLVLQEKNKKNVNAFSKDPLWEGMSLKDFEGNINDLGVQDKAILDKSLFAIKEKLYAKQVKAQEEYIKLFYSDYDKKTLRPGFSDSDVPEKMKTLGEIKEDRQKFLQQEEATFKDNFGTEGSANGAWGKHRSESYGGASTNAEAVDFLVDQQIKTQAFEMFKYSYKSMNKFIFDQMYKGVDKTKFELVNNYDKLVKDNQITDSFSSGQSIPDEPDQHVGNLLKDDNNKLIYELIKKEDWSEDNKSDKTNYEWAPYKELKVWFLASGAKYKMAVEKTKLNELVNGSTNSGTSPDTLYQVRNMVLGIKYDEKDGRNPLDVDNQFLINMLERHEHLAYNKKNNKQHGYDIIDKVMTKVDSSKDDVAKKAETFIAKYTPKPDGTAEKGGSLGIMTFRSAAEQFVPGFWAGIGYALKNQATIPSISFREIFNKFLNDNDGKTNTPPHVQTLIDAIKSTDRDQHSRIERAVAALSETEKNMVFSDIWHSFTDKAHGNNLDLTKGFPFVLKIKNSTNVFLVYSKQFGFHLVKFEEKTQTNLETILTKGLKKMADDKSSEIEVDISKLITKRLSNPVILKTILENKNDEFKDERAELMKQRKKINNNEDISEVNFVKKLNDLLGPLLSNKNLNTLLNKFTNDVRKQFLEMEDNHIFASTPIEDIYDAAKEEMGVQ